MNKKEYLLFKNNHFCSFQKEKEDYSKKYYLAKEKRIINFVKQHRKARKENNYGKMAYIEYKLKQMNCSYICKKLHSKKYIELIRYHETQIKIINYIEKEGFISPDFENVGLNYNQILNTCKILTNNGILQKRNCKGLAYEFNQERK